MHTFGEQVRKEREKRELSQLDLAIKAKIDPGTVSRIEREEQRPSKVVRRKLSRILGLTTEYGKRKREA